MSKRLNIEIADDRHARVKDVVFLRRISLREASAEAWDAWLLKNEAVALAHIARFKKAARAGRRVIAA